MAHDRLDEEDWITDRDGLMQMIGLSPHEVHDQIAVGDIAVSMEEANSFAAFEHRFNCGAAL